MNGKDTNTSVAARKPPLAACSRGNCGDCSLPGKVNCHQHAGEITNFMALAVAYLIPFVGGMIGGGHLAGLAVWVGLSAFFFAFGQQWLICRRCPQYATPGRILLCHGAPWLPKIPKYNPKPFTRFDRWVLIIYTIVLFFYYVPFFVVGGQWLLLATTTGIFVAWAWTVKRQYCTRCLNMFCPFHSVPGKLRAELVEAYPDLRKTMETRL